MTIGIYCLHFEGTDKVYIGKSKHIEERYRDHLYYFRLGKATEKLQKAYNDFGTPKLEVIFECQEKELYLAEIEAIEIYNSYLEGFNSTRGGELGGRGKQGPEHSSAKYTKEQILKCFNLLVHSSMLFKDIENNTGVTVPNINKIAAGTRHTWLKELFPIEYTIMINKKGNRNTNTHSAIAKGIVYPVLLSPEGKKFNVTNTRAFARENNLDAGNLGKVLRKQVSQCKGWRLLDGQ